MSRVHLLILLGALVILSPYVGLPLKILAWLLPFLGIAIIGTSISLRSRRRVALPNESAP